MIILPLSSNTELSVITTVVTALQEGKVVVIPTDTVYGITCDAKNQESIKRIFEIKKRDETKALPVLVSDFHMMRTIATVSDEIKNEIKKYNSITAVLPSQKIVFPALTDHKDTIGVRIPTLPFLIHLIKNAGVPLIGTSANISGEDATTDIGKIIEIFSKSTVQPDIIVDAGILPQKAPSTIIDFTNTPYKTLRVGSV